MRRRRGYTLVEMITVAGIGLVVASLVGSLYLTITRAIETELARSEMVAGAREVSHYLKSDVRRADSIAVSAEKLALVSEGERITYTNSSGGVSRQSTTGARLLGSKGITAGFSSLGGNGVEITLTAERTVRSRTITLYREIAVARRNP
jgi:prepilin-type N-terminal cleavage/methylation domain-containing protein